MAEMTVELVSVERLLWSGQATAVFTRTTEGEIGILPRHIPLLGELVPDCVVRIDLAEGDRLMAAVQGGFLSVTGERVSILAESAQLGDEIDVAAAQVELDDEDEDVRARAASQLRAAGQTV
ncbi:MAG TPA: F0F1 ATP synthase subunit epsilon [Pseudonocardiaceae bacterium]|nr:F0F1 ATP synthase subunit epsilon [Pseudonocardiaceae bacterium]